MLLEFTPNIMLKAGSQSCRLVSKYIKSAQYVTKHLYDSLTQFDVRENTHDMDHQSLHIQITD